MEVVWSFIEASVLRFESPGQPRSLHPLGLVSKGGVLLYGSSLLFFLLEGTQYHPSSLLRQGPRARALPIARNGSPP